MSVEIPSEKGRSRSWNRRLMRVPRSLIILISLLVGMTFGILALSCLLAGDLYEYQDSVDGVHLPKVDAIVVLAGGRGRIAAAGDIWYRYWELVQNPMKGPMQELNPPPVRGRPPLLYLSGMGPQSTFSTLSRHLRRGVWEAIRPDDVVLENESTNTDANARWLLRNAKLRGWDSILIITSPYHMKRARFMFERVLYSNGFPMRIETLSAFQEPFEPGEWRSSLIGLRVTLFEYFKWIYYRYFWKP